MVLTIRVYMVLGLVMVVAGLWLSVLRGHYLMLQRRDGAEPAPGRQPQSGDARSAAAVPEAGPAAPGRGFGTALIVAGTALIVIGLFN